MRFDEHWELSNNISWFVLLPFHMVQFLSQYVFLLQDGYCRREIKKRIVIAKEALNKLKITVDKQAKH
jgi:hypothetical protein